jgi:hypothetical protein
MMEGKPRNRAQSLAVKMKHQITQSVSHGTNVKVQRPKRRLNLKALAHYVKKFNFKP